LFPLGGRWEQKRQAQSSSGTIGWLGVPKCCPLFKQNVDHISSHGRRTLFKFTDGEFEPNAGDEYSQLGDSATAAVLDGAVRAVLATETFVLIGLGIFLVIKSKTYVFKKCGGKKLLLQPFQESLDL
jgi:hypothetical protein